MMSMVELIPETEIPLIIEVLKRFISYEADDDIATPDDIIAIEEGEKEYMAGQTLSLDDFEKGVVTIWLIEELDLIMMKNVNDKEYERELEKARAEYKDLMERGAEDVGDEDDFDELMKELYTDEELSEFDLRARFLDAILKAYDENMGISRERLVEITVEFLENLKIKEPALA